MAASPTPHRRAGRRPSGPTVGLFVRIAPEYAQRLDRAALELRLPKQRLVSGLLDRYVDPDSPESLAMLGQPTAPVGVRKVTIETTEPEGLAVGHHSFRPRKEPDVLTLEEAAELLQVDRELVRELARSGELPGRELRGEWRFARAALLQWLGAGDR